VKHTNFDHMIVIERAILALDIIRCISPVRRSVHVRRAAAIFIPSMSTAFGTIYIFISVRSPLDILVRPAARP
jgi:hypothetical protein